MLDRRICRSSGASFHKEKGTWPREAVRVFNWSWEYHEAKMRRANGGIGEEFECK